MDIYSKRLIIPLIRPIINIDCNRMLIILTSIDFGVMSPYPDDNVEIVKYNL